METCAEVIPFQNPQKAEYQNAIRMWCVNRNLSDALIIHAEVHND